MKMTEDERFMRRALNLAKKAASLGEVPVGAVVVRDGKVIATGYNRREGQKNALRHAELTALDRACKKLGGWRLIGCTLYVTLEPCPMCAGAIINSRVERVVYGASDAKAGACGSVADLFAMPFNHHPAVERGVLGDACAAVLKEFFAELRKRRKKPAADPEMQSAPENE